MHRVDSTRADAIACPVGGWSGGIALVGAKQTAASASRTAPRRNFSTVGRAHEPADCRKRPSNARRRYGGESTEHEVDLAAVDRLIVDGVERRTASA
jgi:hypothetical protein